MNLLQEYIIVVLVLIFIKNWLNEYYNIIYEMSVLFPKTKNDMNYFWFLHNYEKNICSTTFYSYKTSNPVENGRIFFNVK